LFDLIEEAPGTAADVEKSKLALIASGEHSSQLRQCLTTNGIGSPIEEHLDLGVVPFRRLIRHPAARLEMEVLEIIVWSLPDSVFVQDLTVTPTLSAAMDFWKILKKEPGALQQRQQ